MEDKAERYHLQRVLRLGIPPMVGMLMNGPISRFPPALSGAS